MPDCEDCKDTGVIETGNNDLPCPNCPAGQTAVFNTPEGAKTGAELLARLYVTPPQGAPNRSKARCDLNTAMSLSGRSLSFIVSTIATAR